MFDSRFDVHCFCSEEPVPQMGELRVVSHILGMVKVVMRGVSAEGQTLVHMPGEVEAAVLFGGEH